MIEIHLLLLVVSARAAVQRQQGMKHGGPGDALLVAELKGPPLLKAQRMEALELGQATLPLFGEILLDLSEITIPVRQHDEEIRGIAIAMALIYPGKGVGLRVVPHDLRGMLQPNAVRGFQHRVALHRMVIFEGRKVHDEVLSAPPGGMPRGPIVEVHFLGRDDHLATSSSDSEGSTTAMAGGYPVRRLMSVWVLHCS